MPQSPISQSDALSQNDDVLTKKLEGTAVLLELQVGDHLIVTPYGEYFSWAYDGLI